MADKVTSGSLLISEPFMDDVNFRRTVILICDHHDTEGTVGFILNRQIDIPLNELMKDFPEFEAQVFYGGPVATNTIHYIHNVGDILNESVFIARGVYWGGDFEQLKFLIQTKLIQPENIKFFIGYSGWSEGQMAEELAYNAWIKSYVDSNYIFRTRPELLWRQVLEHKGYNYEVIAQIPDDPIYN